MVTSIDTKTRNETGGWWPDYCMLGWSELSVHRYILAETVIVNYGYGLLASCDTFYTYNCTSEVYNYLVSVVDVVLREGECGLLVR
jgi:hypothetical protein